MAKLVIRTLKRKLYVEANKIKGNDQKLEKPQTKDKLFQIEVLKVLLNDLLEKV